MFRHVQLEFSHFWYWINGTSGSTKCINESVVEASVEASAEALKYFEKEMYYFNQKLINEILLEKTAHDLIGDDAFENYRMFIHRQNESIERGWSNLLTAAEQALVSTDINDLISHNKVVDQVLSDDEEEYYDEEYEEDESDDDNDDDVGEEFTDDGWVFEFELKAPFGRHLRPVLSQCSQRILF